jgi:hypothetical protein
MAQRPDRAPLSANRKQAFLAELSKHGVAIRAARAASPGSTTGALTTFKDERARDEAFARAWDEAIENAHASLLEELIRRGKDGVDVPLQDASGNIVGWKKQYSDKLLLAAVQARFKDFTPRLQSEVVAKVRAESMGLDELTPTEQDKLREVLESVLARRALPSANEAEPYSALPIEERAR